MSFRIFVFLQGMEWRLKYRRLSEAEFKVDTRTDYDGINILRSRHKRRKYNGEIKMEGKQS